MSLQLKEKNRGIATILAFAVIPVSGLATDIYLPSMPSMAVAFHQPAAGIQLTLTLFMVSMGITQLWAGPVLDAFGRYRATLTAILALAVSLWITAHTTNIYIVYAMRILQGMLSGFAIVGKRAFFVDVYEGDARKHYLSIMTIIWSLGPIIAPFLGGYLQKIYGWQANFNLLSYYCLLLFILEWAFSGESLKEKNPINLRFIGNKFRSMFLTPDFFFGMLMCGISYGTIFFYNLCGPFIIEHTLGHSSIATGYVSLAMGLSWMAGGFLGKGLINKPLLPKLRISNFLQLAIITLMFVTSFLYNNICTFAIFAFLVHLAAGFIFNNYFTYCLGRFPKAAGLSGGLTGGVAFCLTSLFSYGIAALIKPASQSTLAIGYFVFAVLGFIVLLSAGHKTYPAPHA